MFREGDFHPNGELPELAKQLEARPKGCMVTDARGTPLSAFPLRASGHQGKVASVRIMGHFSPILVLKLGIRVVRESCRRPRFPRPSRGGRCFGWRAARGEGASSLSVDVVQEAMQHLILCF
jgi:hypothetical protein